jgi:hypothetical protein
MLWKIEFYNKKVAAEIKKWPKGMIAKFLWISDIIEKYGPIEIGMPHIKALGQGLFEIRVKAQEEIGRACFVPLRAR